MQEKYGGILYLSVHQQIPKMCKLSSSTFSKASSLSHKPICYYQGHESLKKLQDYKVSFHKKNIQ